MRAAGSSTPGDGSLNGIPGFALPVNISVIARTMLRPGIWRTKDGQVCTIREMATPHLFNAIALLGRRGPESCLSGMWKDKMRELCEEAKKRLEDQIQNPRPFSEMPEESTRSFKFEDL